MPNPSFAQPTSPYDYPTGLAPLPESDEPESWLDDLDYMFGCSDQPRVNLPHVAAQPHPTHHFILL